jgi:hypothetical protein
MVLISLFASMLTNLKMDSPHSRAESQEVSGRATDLRQFQIKARVGVN